MFADFDRAQKVATTLLLNQEFQGFFIDIRNFNLGKNIIIDSIQNYCKKVQLPVSSFTCSQISGCFTIKYKNINLVLYEDSQQYDYRKLWGIAHEVGHIYLGHQKDGSTEEVEANAFAAQVLSPEIVVRALAKKKRRLDKSLIMNHFHLSGEAAEKRYHYIKNKHTISYSQQDQLLLKKFLPFIGMVRRSVSISIY